MLGDVVRLIADETSALEAWEWLTDDPYLRVVEASKDSEAEDWQVLVGVARSRCHCRQWAAILDWSSL